MTVNWLRVFRSTDASRIGEGERQHGHIAMVFGPSAPDTQTAIPFIFSFSFNDLQRFSKLATSSREKHH
jgi:hypothetical protein